MTSVRTDLAADTIESALEDLSANVDERALIKHHYDNSLQKTGFSRQAIMQDLLNAKLLANQKSLSKERAELSAALMLITIILNNFSEKLALSSHFRIQNN